MPHNILIWEIQLGRSSTASNFVQAKDSTYIAQQNQHGKWEHTVSVYQKHTTGHLKVANLIWGNLPMFKAQAIEMRNNTLNKP
jgi:hypothetical protein